MWENVISKSQYHMYVTEVDPHTSHFLFLVLFTSTLKGAEIIYFF